MRQFLLYFVFITALFTLAGCHQGYSPNTYAADAAQQEAAVQRGVIIGVRQVQISANGAVGAATGGAAGGVAGSQVPGAPLVTALGAIGGTLAGGIGGAVAEQAVADSKGWEYIVQEADNKLVSVTQTSKVALAVGQRVLVITGSQQARIVADYTMPLPPPPPNTATAEVNLGPLPAATAPAAALQLAPMAPPAAPPAAPNTAPNTAPPASAPKPAAPAKP